MKAHRHFCLNCLHPDFRMIAGALTVVGLLLFAAASCTAPSAKKLWSKLNTASLSPTEAMGLYDSPAAGADAANGSPTLLTLAPGEDLTQMIRQAPSIVLIDFFAEWCGPCKKQAKILESLAAKRSGDAVIIKVDIDQHPQIADQYSVQSLPTLVVIDGGQIVARETGLLGEQRIASLLGVQ